MNQEPEEVVPDWQIFTGIAETSDIKRLAKFPPPPWRDFSRDYKRGQTYRASKEQIRLVNAALYLRRPLLITGQPGVGKSSLAYSVAEALGLGPVLRWDITSRSTLADGLYRYDAIGRMQEAQLNPEGAKIIEEFLTLGPLGSSLAPNESNLPRALLIDEIDKSDLDLPNDLLNVFEEGEFDIPELARIANPDRHTIKLFQSNERVSIIRGKLRCNIFPFVVMTSNGERDFPPPFLRRCIRMEIDPPNRDELAEIAMKHLADHFVNEPTWKDNLDKLISLYLDRRTKGKELLANDQLLNAVYLTTHSKFDSKDELINALIRSLGQLDA